jgi:hypothetical protein
MIFDTLPGKYKVFVAGLRTDMKVSELQEILRPFGPIEKLSLKVRSKFPNANLGYGILATNSRETYDNLINKSSLQLEGCKVEFRDYSVHRCMKVLMDNSKNSVYLKGFSPKKSMSQIKKEILEHLEEKIDLVDEIDFTPETMLKETKVVRVVF